MKKASRLLSLALALVMLLAITVPGMPMVNAEENFDVTINAGDALYMPYGMGPQGNVVGLYANGSYGAHITFPYEATEAGTYTLTLNQAFGSAQQIPGKGTTVYLSVYDNGNFVKELSFPMTGDWGTFADVPFELDLTAGKHYITFWHENTNSCGGPNIDYLDIKLGDTSTRLEAETVGAYQNAGMGGQPLGGFYTNRLAAAMFTIENVPAAGYYELALTFQNGNPEAGGNDAKLAMLVNGKYEKDILLPDQVDWSTNETHTETVYLKAGTNTVRYWRFDMTLPNPLQPDDGGAKAAPNLVSLNVKPHTHTKDAGVETPPTCDDGGYTTFTCTDTTCGHQWTENELPPTHKDEDTDGVCDLCLKDCCDHDYTATVTPPNCTEKGFTTYDCSKCSSTYKADYQDENGHAMGGWKVTKKATTSAKGEEKRECANCDHFETREIPVLPPKYNTVLNGVDGLFNAHAMKIGNEHAGFSGTGFVEGFYCNPGAHITFNVEVPADGEYDVILGYAMGTNEAKGNPGKLSIYVNYNKACETTFEPGETWATYLQKSEKLTLKAGKNTITYWAENNYGDPAPNVDYIEIAGTRYEAEDAVLPINMGAPEGSTVLAGFFNNPQAAVQYNVSGVPASGKYTLSITYSNGNPEAESKPAKLALLVNGKYVADLSLAHTENWDEFKVYNVELNLTEGNNNITLWKTGTEIQGANIKSIKIIEGSPNTGDASMIPAVFALMLASGTALVGLVKKEH